MPGKQACAECHDDIAADLASGTHADIACETCHGPGLDHANYADSIGITKPSGRDFCGLCHSFNPAKKKAGITMIDLADHNVDNDCIECHPSHKPTELKEP